MLEYLTLHARQLRRLDPVRRERPEMTRHPWQAVDMDAVVRRFPPPPDYFETAWFDEPDTIARRQLVRLRERAWQAYEVPFFRRRWDEAGFHPSSLRSVEDLWKVPSYTVDDIRLSIETRPPFGDYQGVTPADAAREPMRLHMSGGTTGASRPTFYTAWDRAVGTVLLARQMYMQGLRSGDVVLNSWAYGLHNGAFAFDEAAYNWLNCVVLTASTGNVTSTRHQVELIVRYGAAAVLTTGDYLLRLADAAEEMGYDPRSDFALKAIPNVGRRELLEERFGVEYFATYGFHEVQTVALECPAHDGLHVFEDAFVVQVVDPDTGERVPDGQRGSLCVTEIHKTGSPQFRYNIMDLSSLYPPGQCACGSWLRRIGPFAGRADNMVKLRGVNVWPEALGELAQSVPGTTEDFFVRAVRAGGRDELILSVVSDRARTEHPVVRDTLEDRLRERLGLRIEVEVVSPGVLDDWTEVNTAPKPKRFRDEREPIS
jgi:phenylacetate-CoA ligase